MNILVHLARSEDRLLSIREIGEACGMTGATAFKMVRAGLLATERGRDGGVRLGRDPSDIPAGEVVRAMIKSPGCGR